MLLCTIKKYLISIFIIPISYLIFFVGKIRLHGDLRASNGYMKLLLQGTVEHSCAVKVTLL
jgi:hypothetical protein